MKYNWKLIHKASDNTLSWVVSISVATIYKEYYYSREFTLKDLKMLDFLLQELTYIPDWISPHKIQKIQHRLGNAVWDKLGERE